MVLVVSIVYDSTLSLLIKLSIHSIRLSIILVFFRAVVIVVASDVFRLRGAGAKLRLIKGVFTRKSSARI